MELYTLRKVVDPHRNMPKDIKDSFFEAFKDESRGNDSYINFTVGEYVNSLRPGDEDDEYYNSSLATFDKWMMENFELNESVILLYWW